MCMFGSYVQGSPVAVKMETGQGMAAYPQPPGYLLATPKTTSSPFYSLCYPLVYPPWATTVWF